MRRAAEQAVSARRSRRLQVWQRAAVAREATVAREARDATVKPWPQSPSRPQSDACMHATARVRPAGRLAANNATTTTIATNATSATIIDDAFNGSMISSAAAADLASAAMARAAGVARVGARGACTPQFQIFCSPVES